MTLATYTSTVYNNSAKFTHIGNVTVDGTAKWTAAGSVGDVLFLAKIPNGAKIVDCYEYHTSGQTAAAWSVSRDSQTPVSSLTWSSIAYSAGPWGMPSRLSRTFCP